MLKPFNSPNNAQELLFIEPYRATSTTPLIDNFTMIMTAAFRQSLRSMYGYMGVHTCRCGAISDNRDYFIGRYMTNSLCIHYLAFHRLDVSISELRKVQTIAGKYTAMPTAEELHKPSSTKR